MTGHSRGALRSKLAPIMAGWRGEVVMAGLACALVLLAFPDVAFGGRTFSSAWTVPGINGAPSPPPDLSVPPDPVRVDRGASAWQFEPWAEVTARAWRSGEVPLWNPHEGLGVPLAANFQSATFDPLLTLVNLHPTPLAWDISFLFAFFFGAISMYFFLRYRGVGRLPALIGTAPFILSGYFFFFSNIHFFRSYLYLPVLCLLADWTARSLRLLPPITLGLAVAANILLGMPETSVFVLGLLSTYCLYITFFSPTRSSPLVTLLRFAGAATLGLALAAPLLLPAKEYLPLSYSIHEAGNKLGVASDKPNGLLNWLLPYAFGQGSYNFRRTAFSGTRNWVGVGSMLVALAALASPRALRRFGGSFFAVVIVLVLAKGYGFPMLRWVGYLPIMKLTIISVYAFPLVSFCFGVLVAIGLQGLLDGELRILRFFVLLGLFLIAVIPMIWINAPLLREAPSRYLIPQVAVALFVGFGIIVGLQTAKLRSGFSHALVALAILGELIVLVPRGYLPERRDSFVHPNWLEYLRELGIDKSKERVFGIDGRLYPNTAGAYGLQDIAALDALYPERYVSYIRNFIEPRFYDRFVAGEPLRPDGGASSPKIVDNPMFDLTGVRYVITGVEGPLVPPPQYHKIYSSDGSMVFENSHHMPRAFLLYEVSSVRDFDGAVNVLKEQVLKASESRQSSAFDPATQVVVEGFPQMIQRHLSSCAKRGVATIRSYRNNAVVLDVETDCPGIVLLTDLFYPGWRATVNGKEATIYPADVAFRAVTVKAGRSRVEFHYRPRSFRNGIALAGVAALGAIGALVGQWLFERRRHVRRQSSTSGSGFR